MTRSYRARRITQPIVHVRRSSDPAIESHTFTCFRLVPGDDGLVALRLHHSDTRMFVFTRITRR